MAQHRSASLIVLLASVALMGMALVGCGNSAGASKSGAAAAGGASVAGSAIPAGRVEYTGSEKILVSDPASRVVTANLVGGQGNAAGGFNFNGYGNGDMQVQVPTGWTVKVSFIVESETPHSAVIAPWDERQANSFNPAFTGSAGAELRAGIEKGDDPQTFSFTADKAGQYAIVCGVPGHESAGMWDEFDVVDNLAAPRILVKK